jgi:peptide-methionine (R)-S-oxide reductase
MTRRPLLASLCSFVVSAIGLAPKGANAQAPSDTPKVEPLRLSDADWKKRLSPEQYAVLRQEGTERAGTSALNGEHRKGVFRCAGCELALFSAETKFDSGTGWPSFYAPLPGAVVTKTDFKLVLPRTEYHCARCEGHQGHVFDDGPRPTGKRYCNNGVALKFVAA